jgi:hypothetical protein
MCDAFLEARPGKAAYVVIESCWRPSALANTIHTLYECAIMLPRCIDPHSEGA